MMKLLEHWDMRPLIMIIKTELGVLNNIAKFSLMSNDLLFSGKHVRALKK